jgi:hypothetical protein
MRRLTIERLELDFRGVPHATADIAARRLGPALSRALANRQLKPASAARIDAGSIAIAAPPDANVVAARIAQQIAGKISRSRS